MNIKDNKDNKEYKITLPNDNTLKQLFDRFYVIPKDKSFTEEELNILVKYSLGLEHDTVERGENGYIVFRGVKKKLFNKQQCEAIKTSTLTQRELSKKYNCSVGTINKIKNNTY